MKSKKTVDHLANERTFLSWTRLALGLMAFGFVVEKFTLFVRQLGYLFAKNGLSETTSLHPGYASIFGVLLVLFGGAMGLLSYFIYKRHEKEIEEETFKTYSPLPILLTVAICLIAILLTVYLIYSDLR